jgi:hypothetical protein
VRTKDGTHLDVAGSRTAVPCVLVCVDGESFSLTLDEARQLGAELEAAANAARDFCWGDL